MEEMVNRRSFLQKAAVGGGGLLIFAAGGVAWRAWDRGSFGKIYEGTAFDPWEDWRNNRFKEYQLARIVKDSGLQVVFGFRCGYARQAARPAPRRGVNEVIEGV
jgi:hypothetical protein